MATRHDLVAEARSWVGTPWGKAGAMKGHHTNCFGYLVCCFQALNLKPLVKAARPYACRAMPEDQTALRDLLDRHLEIANRYSVQVGNLILISSFGWQRHLALITEAGVNGSGDVKIIHCTQYDGVKEHQVRTHWTVGRVYRVPGLDP
jgi:hypothetical protein